LHFRAWTLSPPPPPTLGPDLLGALDPARQALLIMGTPYVGLFSGMFRDGEAVHVLRAVYWRDIFVPYWERGAALGIDFAQRLVFSVDNSACLREWYLADSMCVARQMVAEHGRAPGQQSTLCNVNANYAPLLLITNLVDGTPTATLLLDDSDLLFANCLREQVRILHTEQRTHDQLVKVVRMVFILISPRLELLL
jgi:hypothetical protein